MKTTRHDPIQCPVCLKEFDCSTIFDHNVSPSPGDFSICIFCGSINVFGEGLRIFVATDEQIGKLDPQSKHNLFKTVAAVKMLIRK